MTPEIEIVDCNNPNHCRDLPEMLDGYARDPMGGGKPLAKAIKTQLMTELSKLPSYIGFLVYQNDKPVAFANCFMGFSTFACKPLLNIHDFAVHPEHRGQGLSQMLMKGIAAKAKESGCCKLTLEVLSGNTSAIKAYKKFGFALYQLDEKAGTAQFMECTLS